MTASLEFRPIDDGARSGRSVLLRKGEDFALGFWNGAAFVYPAAAGRAVDFNPTSYYDPTWRSAGAVKAGGGRAA